MQGIPWSTIALGSLLLISVCSKGGQEAQSTQPEKSQPPVKMEQRGRILGIGGIFFKSANRDQMRQLPVRRRSVWHAASHIPADRAFSSIDVTGISQDVIG